MNRVGVVGVVCGGVCVEECVCYVWNVWMGAVRALMGGVGGWDVIGVNGVVCEMCV